MAPAQWIGPLFCSSNTVARQRKRLGDVLIFLAKLTDKLGMANVRDMHIGVVPYLPNDPTDVMTVAL